VVFASVSTQSVWENNPLKRSKKSIAQLGTISSYNDTSCHKGHCYQVLLLMVCAAYGRHESNIACLNQQHNIAIY
jgi:hypothetical protein